MKLLQTASLLLVLGALPGCAATALHSGGNPRLAAGGRWVVAPFANYTTTPGAGRRAASMTASLLLTHGVKQAVMLTPHHQNGLPLESIPHAKAILAKANRQNARYIVEGAVQEWRYTIGLDGQPAVAVTLNVVSARTGQILWTATGSRSGSPRESVGVLAEDTLNAMLGRLSP